MAKNGKYETDWLSLLRNGDSPLLTRRELEYIAEVRNRIILEAKLLPEKPSHMDLKDLSVLKDNFEKIVTFLNKNSEAKGYFIDVYPTWRKFRDLNIKQLKNIAGSVNKESEDIRDAMGVSNTISLVGGLLSFVGTYVLRLVGAILVGLGAVSNFLFSKRELNMLGKKVKEAQDVIEKDRKFSEKLWDWLNDASYVQEALNIVKGINIDRSFISITKEFLADYKKGNEWGSKAIDIIIEKAMATLEFSPENAKEISDVIGILIAVYMLKENYSSLFDQVSEAFKCSVKWSSACYSLTARVNLGASIALIEPWQLSNFQKSKIYTGMALNALNLFVIAKNMGSKRKEAEEIIKAAQKLEEEADIFEELYDVLNGRGPRFGRYPISF